MKVGDLASRARTRLTRSVASSWGERRAADRTVRQWHRAMGCSNNHSTIEPAVFEHLARWHLPAERAYDDPVLRQFRCLLNEALAPIQ